MLKLRKNKLSCENIHCRYALPHSSFWIAHLSTLAWPPQWHTAQGPNACGSATDGNPCFPITAKHWQQGYTKHFSGDSLASLCSFYRQMRELWGSREEGCLVTAKEWAIQLLCTLDKAFPCQKFALLSHFLISFCFKNGVFPYKWKQEN